MAVRDSELVDEALARAPVKGRSLWGDAWLRLKANRAAMASLMILALITMA